MTRRFAAGVATGILITILSGVATAAYTDPSLAAGPSGPAAAAHAASGTKPAGAIGDPSVGTIAIRGGEYTVTAVNGNTITATTNGISLVSSRIMSGTIVAPGVAGAQVITGTTDGAGISGAQIMTATATAVGPGSAGPTFTIGTPGAGGASAAALGPISTTPMTVTITVDATTVYSRAEQAATLSDVQVGSILQVEGTHTSATSINASTVEIVLPQRLGVVTAVNGDSLTVTGFDARPYTVAADSNTVVHRAGQTAALTDIAVGSLISAEGTLSSDGLTLNALAITIQLPNVAGKVTAVSGNTVTVQSPDGTTSTVQLTDTTTYNAGPKDTADQSSVVVGSFIMAEGTIGSDGSLTALQVTVGGVTCGVSLSKTTSATGGQVTVTSGPAC
jgi:hypothetical protein